MADETPDVDQIEQDLAETRARMDRRLDQLGDRLAPNQLVNDALSHATGGGGADFAQTLIAKAKANPIPAVLAGIGFTWLLASSETKRGRAADLPTRLRSAEAGVVRMNDEHPDVHASRVADARGQVLGVARTSSDTTASYSQRIKEAVAAANKSARRTSHDMGNGASQTFARFGEQARSNGHALAGGAASPGGRVIAIGAGAALVGLIAGTLIPTTDQEERALSGAAGRLRSTGRDLAQDVVDRGGNIAADMLEGLRGSAEAHGLTADKSIGEVIHEVQSRELVGHIKQVAQETLQAGKESTQTHMAAIPVERGS